MLTSRLEVMVPKKRVRVTGAYVKPEVSILEEKCRFLFVGGSNAITQEGD